MWIARTTRAAALWVLVLASSTAGAVSKIDEARELQQQGKLEAAGQLLEAAAAEYRASGDSRNLARALGIAADISVAAGRYEAAIRQAGEALKLRSAIRDAASIGDDHNTIALAYQYLGNYPAALDHYREALAADRARADAEGEITRLNNIGNICYFQGRYSDALRSYEDAMQKLGGALGASWYAARRQLTIANLAVLFQRLGQEQRALDYYRTLAGPEGSGSAHAMPAGERAQLLLNQGVLYRRLGDPVKALELYRAAQDLFAADRHPDGEIGALRNIGIVLAMDLNDLPGAVKTFTQALDLSRRSSNRRGMVQASLYRGEVLRRQHLPDAGQADLERALREARPAGLVEEQWKSLHALGRIAEDGGRWADAEQDYRRAISIIESVRTGLRLVAMRSDFLADKREVYDSLIGLRLRDAGVTPAEIFNWMERSRARTLLDRLRGRKTPAEPRLDAVQARLDPGTVLVEYWIGPNRGAALWMTLADAGLIRYDDTTRWRSDPAAAGIRILQGIPPANRLIVVPDNILSEVPFETLRAPGSGELLIEKCEVSYLPSARFVALKRPVEWRPPWAVELVALADPSVSSNLFDERWEPLPASADEARAIARIVPGGAQVHLGGDMRKRYLSGMASSGAPLLHLATHAMIDAENPDRSRILFAGDYLLQEEVYDLDLRGVDLVTLSACDTARGRFVGGESAQAFSQAFLAAGAGAVVTSLWRVADGPTSDFMQQFYYALARGESKGAALRSAKLRFLRSRTSLADSRNWAAFVLTGDGSTPVPRAIPWSACLLAAAVAMVLIALPSGRVRAARRTRGKP